MYSCNGAGHQSPLSHIIQNNKILKPKHNTFELSISRIAPRREPCHAGQQFRGDNLERGTVHIIPYLRSYIFL